MFRRLLPCCTGLWLVWVFPAAGAAADPAATAGPQDVQRLRQMVGCVYGWDGAGKTAFEPSLRAELERLAQQLSTAPLQEAAGKLIPELEQAALLRPRIAALARDIEAARGRYVLEPAGPPWLRPLVGEDAMQLFARLTVVDMFDRNLPPKSGQVNEAVDDAWVERLAGLPHLKTLDLSATAITDESLKVVGSLRTLQRLNLTLTRVTDPGLAALAGLTDMRHFSLASTKCTGQGMAHLQGWSRLENLNFHYTPVNDQGLEAIGRLASLVRLEIVHVHFTDTGAQHLARLTNLQRLQIGSREASAEAVAAVRGLPRLFELDLHDWQASPEGLRYAGEIPNLYVLRYYGPLDDAGADVLGQFKRLHTLHLPHTQLTDAGLRPLAQLTGLTRLHVHSPRLTPQGREALRKALPQAMLTP